MFIHFNFVAGAYPKCWRARISPVWGGAGLSLDRASYLLFLLSSIYHHPSICFCLFTSIVSIHLDQSSQQLSDWPSWTPTNLSDVLLSVSPTFDPGVSVCIYIFAVSWALSVSSGLSIKVDYLCVSVHPFHPVYHAPENLVLLLDGIFKAAGASTRGSLSETLENLSGGRLWGDIDKALKRFWIPITSPLLTVSSSPQLSEDETDGRDGRASAVETFAGETTPAGVKTAKGDESACAVCTAARLCWFLPMRVVKRQRVVRRDHHAMSTERERSHVGRFCFGMNECGHWSLI